MAAEEPDVSETSNFSSLSLDPEDIEEIRSSLVNYGVSEEQTDALIKKLKDGYIWDSLDPNEHPISSEKFTNDQEKGIIEHFGDGSVTISSVQLPVEIDNSPIHSLGVIPGTISECELFNAQGYTFSSNCLARKSVILATMSFRFDMYRTVKDAGIMNYYSPTVRGVGVSFDTPTLEQPQESTVRMSSLLSLFVQGFPIQNTAWIQVDVDTDGAYITGN